MSVEVITVVKLVFPIFGFLLVRYCRSVGETNWIHLITVILLYFMVDTVTYLAALIMMADIQKPSANVIRSLLLLFFNYAEVSPEESRLKKRLSSEFLTMQYPMRQL